MKWRLRLGAVLVVGFAAVAAAFAPGEHITMGPPNIVARVGPGSVSIVAHNDGSSSITISGIGKDASCSMTDGTTLAAAFDNFPTNMFTFPISNEPVHIDCPATGPSASNQGIRRCEFFLKKDDTGSGRLVDFTGVCLYQSTVTALTALPTPLVFGNVPVGGTGSAQFVLSTSASVGGFYFSIMDGDDNYTVTNPCVGAHCRDPVPLAAGSQRTITVQCTPKRAGNLDTVMHIVGDNGVRLGSPLALQCNGNGTGGGGGEINLSQEIVTLSEPVNGGMQSANVTLHNDSATDALVISSMQLAGSTAWSLTTSSPCNVLPCSIPPLGMVNLAFEFDPPIIDSTSADNDAMLTIQSNDADEMTKAIALIGTGEGTTLVVDSNITPPVTIGPTTAGVPVTRTFTFRNQPATEPLPFTASISNNPTFSVGVGSGSIPANSTVDVTVTCTPPTAGTHVADFSLMAMPSLGTAPIEFQVQCTATGGTTSGGDINLSQTLVQRSQLITAGPALPASITLQNAHPTDALTINSFALTGSTAWSFAAGSPCSATPCTIPGGGMINLTIGFDPSTIGDNDGVLTINSSDVTEPMATITLDGIGEGTTLSVITPITPPVSIGSTPVGTPVTRTIRFANNPATQPLAFTASVTNNPIFSLDVTSGAIPTNGTQNIVITCTPQAVGVTAANFSLMAMPSVGTAPVTFAVECTGTSAGGSLSWSPNTIALGDVRIGTAPITSDVDLDSTAGSLTPGTPVETPNVSQVTLSAVAPTPINMNGGSKFTVTFDPGTVEGPVATTITLAAGTDTATVSFSANVVKAQLAAPADVDFGSVCVGQTVAARTLKLVSTGSATIHMAQRPELDAMAGSPFTLAYVSPTAYPIDLDTNEEATITVAPKAMPAGSYVDYVSWMTDATNPHTKLEVDYVDNAGGVTPGAVMFEMAQVKQSSAPEKITIQNCAAGTMTIGTLAFDPPGEFMAISAVPASLGPGETAEVTLAFMPQQNGVRTSTLTIPTSTGDLSVMLSGTGLGGTATRSGPASLYACDCSSGDPASGFVIVLALVFPLIPRRRRR